MAGAPRKRSIPWPKVEVVEQAVEVGAPPTLPGITGHPLTPTCNAEMINTLASWGAPRSTDEEVVATALRIEDAIKKSSVQDALRLLPGLGLRASQMRNMPPWLSSGDDLHGFPASGAGLEDVDDIELFNKYLSAIVAVNGGVGSTDARPGAGIHLPASRFESQASVSAAAIARSLLGGAASRNNSLVLGIPQGILSLMVALAKVMLGSDSWTERQQAADFLRPLRGLPWEKDLLEINLKESENPHVREWCEILLVEPSYRRTWNIIENPKDYEEWEDNFATLKEAKSIEVSGEDAEEREKAREAKEKLKSILRKSLVIGLHDPYSLEGPARRYDAAVKAADLITRMLDHPELRGPDNVHATERMAAAGGFIMMAGGRLLKFDCNEIFKVLACLAP